jgi:hypothetical protein
MQPQPSGLRRPCYHRDVSEGAGGARSTHARRGWRITCALIAALIVAAFAFAFRFNSLSGTLGGFDDDHFATLMRVDLLLEGQQPLRDFADFELRGAWPSLSYILPAWAQRLGGRSLLPEAYLTVGSLALAHALLFVLALALSRRWPVALLAAACAIATTPKLYNYPKVLVLTLAVVAIRAAGLAPSWPTLLLAALVTAIAVVFRHDYGVYVAFAMLVSLAARDGRWRPASRRVGAYVGLTTVLLLPSAAWVQMYEGIPSYLRNVAAAATLEAQRTELRLPAPGVSSASDAIILTTFAVFWLAVVVAVAVLVLRRRPSWAAELPAADRATAIGLIALAAIVNLFFLRANLTQRFGDAVAPVALLLAWIAGTGPAIRSPAVGRAFTVSSLGLLGLLLAGSVASTDGMRRLRDAGLLDGWATTAVRFQEVRDTLQGWPPSNWSEVEMGASLLAARYVAQCTSPRDHLLVAGYAPEIHVLARRRFAAGQGTVSLGFYTSTEDQRRALARLATQSVPIVLAEAEDFDEGFASDYPLLAAHILSRYRDAGTMTLDEGRRIRVFVDASRMPTGVDPHLGLPCFN